MVVRVFVAATTTAAVVIVFDYNGIAAGIVPAAAVASR